MINAKKARTMQSCIKRGLFCCRLAVYDGMRHLGPVMAGVRSCGIVACVTDNPSSCAIRSPSLRAAPFAHIKISSIVPGNENTFYFPSSLQTTLTPVPNLHYCNEKLSVANAKIIVETVFEERDLLSFGFYARVYDRDFYIKASGGKLSGDAWMKIFMAAAAASIVASVIFIFFAQKTDLKLKIT